MKHEHVGVPESAPSLRLDHEEFAYSGKFDGDEGKFVTRDDGEVVAALSYSNDRARDDAARVRYIDVRRDRRNDGIASSLLSYASSELLDKFDTVRIGVNRPFAYTAAHNAGFGWTGETAALDQLVMERPAPEGPSYEDGMREFAGRDLSDEERAHLEERIRERF